MANFGRSGVFPEAAATAGLRLSGATERSIARDTNPFAVLSRAALAISRRDNPPSAARQKGSGRFSSKSVSVTSSPPGRESKDLVFTKLARVEPAFQFTESPGGEPPRPLVVRNSTRGN